MYSKSTIISIFLSLGLLVTLGANSPNQDSRSKLEDRISILEGKVTALNGVLLDMRNTLVVERLEAKTIVVVDSVGRTRGEWTAGILGLINKSDDYVVTLQELDVGSIHVLHGTDYPLVSIRDLGGFASIQLYDSNLVKLVQIGEKKSGGGRISVNNNSGLSVAHLTTNLNSGFLILSNPSGNLLASLGARMMGDNLEQSLMIYNSKGEKNCYLGSLDKDGQLLLLDRYGTINFSQSGKQ